MFVSPDSSGRALSLGLADRKEIEKHGYIVNISNGRKTTLRVVPEASQDPYQLKFPWVKTEHQFLVEPGWWIDAHPGYEKRKELGLPIDRFIVTIDKQRWNELLSEGHIATRSIYDRFDITYWEPDMGHNS